MTSDSRAWRSITAREIASHPFLLGIVLSLLLFGLIVAMNTWFSGVKSVLGKFEWFLEPVFFTVIFFAAYVYYFWRWHLRRGFWISVFLFLLLHTVGVFTYSVYVHPLFLWQWSLLGFLESYAGAFFVAWWTARQPQRDTKVHR